MAMDGFARKVLPSSFLAFFNTDGYVGYGWGREKSITL
jgi:hypothetical protein